MNPKHEVMRLLAENKAVLLRSKNHYVFMLPSGERYTCPKTASDHRSWRNSLSQLKRKLRHMETSGWEVRWNPDRRRRELEREGDAGEFWFADNPFVGSSSNLNTGAEIYVSPRRQELSEHDKFVREVSILLKSGDPVAIRIAAEAMLPYVRPGSQIVPMPGHLAGPVPSASRRLAEAIASMSGGVVVEAVRRARGVPSSRERRLHGAPGISPRMHSSSMEPGEPLDPELPVVMVDNVVVGGATFDGARSVLGRPDAHGVAYSWSAR